jgi:hypothetical protein
MPLLGNDTDGAVTRKRLETWAALREKVTVVAATDAATIKHTAHACSSRRCRLYDDTKHGSYLDHTNRCGTRCSVHR